jgi:hypothetical protein
VVPLSPDASEEITLIASHALAGESEPVTGVTLPPFPVPGKLLYNVTTSWALC